MAKSGMSWRSLGASSKFRSVGLAMMDEEAEATISQGWSLGAALARGSHHHSTATGPWISWRRWEPEGRG